MRFEQLVELIERTHYELHSRAARSVDAALVIRNWLFGWYIVEYEQKGEDRAEYGSRLLPRISQQLKQAGIKGASVTNLKNCRLFYERFQVIGQTVSDQSDSQPKLPRVQADRIAISQTLSDQLQGRFCLGWSQYVFLMGIANMDEHRFYEIEVQEKRWSLRELKRQFDSSLYERLVLSRDKKQVKKLSEKGQLVGKAADLLKEPYVLEFLGLDEKNAYSESDLETAIIDKLEHFLLELGKGFLFDARQKRFTFDEDHFYVEFFQLPAPDFRSAGSSTVAVLYGPRQFAQMDREKRIRACYQHACLLYVSGKRMANVTLRKRLGIKESSYTLASRIISDTIDVGLIRLHSGTRRDVCYVPFWA